MKIITFAKGGPLGHSQIFMKIIAFAKGGPLGNS